MDLLNSLHSPQAIEVDDSLRAPEVIDQFNVDHWAEHYCEKLGLDQPIEIINEGVRYQVALAVIQPFLEQLQSEKVPLKSLPVVEILSDEDFAPLLAKLKKDWLHRKHRFAPVQRSRLWQSQEKHLPVLLVLIQVGLFFVSLWLWS